MKDYMDKIQKEMLEKEFDPDREKYHEDLRKLGNLLTNKPSQTQDKEINQSLEKICLDFERLIFLSIMDEYESLGVYFAKILKFYQEIGSKSVIIEPINQNKVKERINQLASLLTNVVNNGYKDNFRKHEFLNTKI